MTDVPYGYCPVCGAPGEIRERRPLGNDRCPNGHTYPSGMARGTPPRTADIAALRMLAEDRLTALLEAEMENTALRAQVEELTANGVSIAKAEDKAYRQGYTDGRDDERAAVVAWLRAPGTCCDNEVLADDIDHGEHRKVQP